MGSALTLDAKSPDDLGVFDGRPRLRGPAGVLIQVHRARAQRQVAQTYHHHQPVGSRHIVPAIDFS